MRLLLRDIGLGFVFAIALALVVKGTDWTPLTWFVALPAVTVLMVGAIRLNRWGDSVVERARAMKD
jgi:hypothetical protein